MHALNFKEILERVEVGDNRTLENALVHGFDVVGYQGEREPMKCTDLLDYVDAGNNGSIKPITVEILEFNANSFSSAG